jgi:hypothetical protein
MFKDKAGNVKAKVTPKPSGVDIQLMIENTIQKQIGGMMNILESFKDKNEKKAESAAKRRKVAPAPALNRPQSNPVHVEDESMTDGEDFVGAIKLIETPRKNVHMSVAINGHPVDVCLDSGSEVDVCPRPMAEKLGLIADASIPSSSIMGLGDHVSRDIRTSIPTPVQFQGQAPVFARFKIGGGITCPILLCPSTMSKLGCCIDFVNKLVLAHGDQFPCTFLTNTLTQHGCDDDFQFIESTVKHSCERAEVDNASKLELQSILMQYSDTWVQALCGGLQNSHSEFQGQWIPKAV